MEEDMHSVPYPQIGPVWGNGGPSLTMRHSTYTPGVEDEFNYLGSASTQSSICAQNSHNEAEQPHTMEEVELEQPG
ncbi:hypothetical protein GCM10009576_061570 [Streptomyces rhizosphaericus]|uniref:Uncharacterized protein n=1 Tax=Streptomyces rhizosphaericus TaxID=114699 RepID=A0ABN1SGN3_9ACTN